MADEHSRRLGRIFDPFGHEWEIGRPLACGRQFSLPQTPGNGRC
jgi:hypothetical protein